MKDFLIDYWYIVIGWPILAAGVSWMQLNGSKPSAYEWTALLLGFLIVGFVAAWQTRWIVGRTANFGSLVGFGIATPIAYLVGIHLPDWNHWIFNLSKPLAFIIVIPLLIGVCGGAILWIGTHLGGMLDRENLQKIN